MAGKITSQNATPKNEQVVEIPLWRANLIIDDLKQLDLLRESYNLSNQLILQLEKDIERLELLLSMEKQKSTLYKEKIDALEERKLNGFERFLADAWKFLAGVAAGLVVGLVVR